ncbi:hypothetical protein NPIL_481881 [Nephila pilipes]|uniref:Uncharacterized protein n=1 Tax=Nephila pilipes TaxID=299642 RepID=A0A8X6QE87_NEPPI|nr:hypothetical protein NPIL_481881 [Nephila pilipes]
MPTVDNVSVTMMHVAVTSPTPLNASLPRQRRYCQQQCKCRRRRQPYAARTSSQRRQLIRFNAIRCPTPATSVTEPTQRRVIRHQRHQQRAVVADVIRLFIRC